MSTQLTPVLHTTGWALAHAVGSIRLGGTLCTLAVVMVGNQRKIIRYEAPTIPQSLAVARGHLANELDDGTYAALVYDGYVTTDERERTDALIVELLGPRADRLGRVAQAYVPTRRFGLPLIGRRCSIVGPLVITETVADDDPETAIYDGVREHPFGARLFGLKGGTSSG